MAYMLPGPGGDLEERKRRLVQRLMGTGSRSRKAGMGRRGGFGAGMRPGPGGSFGGPPQAAPGLGLAMGNQMDGPGPEQVFHPEGLGLVEPFGINQPPQTAIGPANMSGMSAGPSAPQNWQAILAAIQQQQNQFSPFPYGPQTNNASRYGNYGY